MFTVLFGESRKKKIIKVRFIDEIKTYLALPDENDVFNALAAT